MAIAAPLGFRGLDIEELWGLALDSLENLSQPFSVYGKPKMGTVILQAE